MKTTATLFLALAAWALAGCGDSAPPSGGSRPDAEGCSVLLVTLDTARADRIGCYGYSGADTPALDGLAAEGVLFEQAFCAAPLTLPSHVTIMTGLLPPEHGVRENEQKLSGEVTTLAELFREQGYATGAFIGAYVLDAAFNLDQGFDVYDDRLPAGAERSLDLLGKERPADQVVSAALDWLDGIGKDEPFFCWVHLYDPHDPYMPPAPFDARFDDAPYDGEIAFADWQVGRLIEWLDTRGLSGKTLVVAAGDHGEGLWEHDEPTHCFFLYETTMRVPLIFSLPDVLPAGERFPAPVGLADVFPTVAELYGLGDAEDATGRSLVPAFAGATFSPQSQYGESDYAHDYLGFSPLRSLTTPDWKYIRAPEPELYDRAADPAETVNLAGQEKDVLYDLERELAAMELAMDKRQASAGTLSPELRRELQSLGYMAGRDERKPRPTAGELADPKKLKADFRAARAVLEPFARGDIDGALAGIETLPAGNPIVPSLRDRLAAILIERGRHADAERIYRTALEEHENSGIEDGTRLASLHNGLGAALLQAGRNEEAAEHFRKAVELADDYAAAHGNLGTALARLNRFAEALDAMRTALRHDPDRTAPLLELGNTLAHAQRHAGAAEAYREVLSADHGNEVARTNLGRTLYNLGFGEMIRGMHRMGIAHLREGVERNPGDALLQSSLARALAACPDGELRDSAEALRLAVLACRGDGKNNPVFLDALAIAQANAGRFEEAVATAQTAHDLAVRSRKPQLADSIKQRMALFEAKQAYRGFP